MRPSDIHAVVAVLKRAARGWREPVSSALRDPFLVLVSCLLSLRTKDPVTEAASARLFKLARTPGELSRLPIPVIEKAVYPVGFYRTKARTLKALSRTLLAERQGRVPDTMETLLALKGVGRKTANLVLTAGFGKPGICVDTHVHRISNRLGYVRTRTPEETEMALRRGLPQRYWSVYNMLLVAFGQNVCAPVSPWCSRCGVERWCAKRGVLRSR